MSRVSGPLLRWIMVAALATSGAAGCRGSAAGSAPVPAATRTLPDPARAPVTLATPASAVTPVPITFRVVNPGRTPRYLDWDVLRSTPPACERRVGAAWEPCSFVAPFCTEECGPPGQPAGCRRCARPPAGVKLVPAKGSLEITWDGRLVAVEQHARCACTRREAPAPGRYRVKVCAYPSASCAGAACPSPDPIGRLIGVTVRGTPSCTETEVDLPTGAPEVVLRLR
jgi:hypothetical protein